MLCQQFGKLDQYLVTGEFVVDVVDQGKLVDVHVQQSVVGMLGFGVLNRQFHLVEEGLLVDEPGKAVVVLVKAQGFLHVLQSLVHALVDQW